MSTNAQEGNTQPVTHDLELREESPAVEKQPRANESRVVRQDA